MKVIILSFIATVLSLFILQGCAKQTNYDEYYRANKAAKEAHEELRND